MSDSTPSPRFAILPQLPPFSARLMAELQLRGLHCGCGRNLREGWLNADRLRLALRDGHAAEYGRIVLFDRRLYYLQCDLTQALPFDADCFDWAYSEHFIEHLKPEVAIAWLQDIRRVVRPGGLLRISTPDLNKYIEGYLDPERAFFSEHARRLPNSGVKNVPRRRAWMVNQVFYRWGHRWLYDFEELKHALCEAGFSEQAVTECSYQEGRIPEVAQLDLPVRNDESLYAEIVCS